ncbi:hypothetical protein J2W21_000768 [Sinomonas atrocyanea]|uniref:hypothetical protein n=1 Tax=Sinomonas atrocyanea TaxID=37927 RepID=UPI00277F59F1|nr:hypothetical protein [Sinomonas atrocyanea]MDP9883278.1 hypothetical protein [Sinomonas atrocyanea]
MQNLLVALTQTPAPSPSGSLRPGLSEDMITPGNWGFAATAFVVLLTIFLIIDMVRRLRRMRYRAQVEESRGGAEETGAGERSEPSPEDSDPQAPGRGRANGRP